MTLKHIVIDKNTDELIEQCRQELKAHHPEFKEMHLSYNFMIKRMARFYLEN